MPNRPDTTAFGEDNPSTAEAAPEYAPLEQIAKLFPGAVEEARTTATVDPPPGRFVVVSQRSHVTVKYDTAKEARRSLFRSLNSKK
jgi:hypothetical protein